MIKKEFNYKQVNTCFNCIYCKDTGNAYEIYLECEFNGDVSIEYICDKYEAE
jgi:hypothetical protein